VPGRPAPGLALTRHAAALATERPWFAIGGIDLTNLDQVLEAGATRVVVVRALTEAADPRAAAKAFTARLFG
jgi:thiamine-phosphate pyrophosphorylase